MRRLTLLLVAPVLALFGAILLSPLEDASPARVRDAAVIFTVAALIFGISTRALSGREWYIIHYRWPAAGRVLALTGLLCAQTGALLFRIDPAGTALTTARTALWLIGLILLPAGVFWRGAPERYGLPGYRWQRTTSGGFERVPAAAEADDRRVAPEAIRLPGHRIWLLLVLTAGAALRLWQLGTLPAGCVSGECGAALALIDGAVDAAVRLNPVHELAALFYAWQNDAILSLRITAALLGMGALLVAYPVLRRVATPAGALIGVMVLSFSPLHMTAGRTSEPWIVLTLLLLSALALLWRGLHSGARTDWTAAGLLLGLAGLCAPPLAPGLAFWSVMLLLIAVGRRQTWLETRPWIPLLLFVAGVVLPVLPVLNRTMTDRPVLHMDAAAINPAVISVALAAVGIGALFRLVRNPVGSTVLSGTVLVPAGLLVTELNSGLWPLQPPETRSLLLTLLPFALVAATVAADQIVVALVESWSILVRPRRLAALAAAPIAVALLLAAASTANKLTETGSTAADPAGRAMLDAALATNEVLESELVTFLPPAVLASADAQLRARDALASGAVRPLEGIDALLQVDQGMRILTPAADLMWQEVLAAYFPAGRATPVFDEETGALLYTELIVPPPVDFERFNPASIDGSWQGSLLISQPGRYEFDVGNLAADDQFTLLLDNRLLLDTSLGRTVGSELLAEGVYRVDLRFEPAAPANRVFLAWTRPDGVTEFPPDGVLSPRLLPDLGLMATYFPNADFTPPALAMRKDLLLEAPPVLDFPYSVIWQGKLAANRAGEYLLALAADGAARVLVNNTELLVLDPAASGEGSAPAGYAEGIAYLEPGWHDLEIRFAPRADMSTLDLLWQPPGSQPTGLPPVFLRPSSAQLTPIDDPLPPAPPLTDLRLARGDFALTQGVELRRVRSGLLPNRLPTMPIAQRWQTETGCGPAIGQLDRPHGAVMDPATGRIFVADTGNARIAVFDRSGTPLIPLTPRVAGESVLVEPVDVARLSDGTLVVLDAALQQIVRIDPVTGEFVLLGSAGDFYRPRGLAVMSDDIILVADTGGGRIALLAADGTRLFDYGDRESALAQGQPVDVIGTGRDLWAVTTEDGRLWEVNIPGSVTVVARAVSADGPHLALRPDDSFFLSDPAQRSLLYHNADGRPIARVAYPGAFDLPTGVATADLDGEPYLAVVDTARCSLSLWQIP